MTKTKLTIFLFVILTAFFSCRKDPLKYTSRMDGNHSWAGEKRINYNYGSTGLVTQISYDTAIIVQDDHTVILGSRYYLGILDTLHYSSSNKKQKTATFTSKHILVNGGWYYVETYDTLIFNYSNNNITYTQLYIDNKNNYKEYVNIHTL